MNRFALLVAVFVGLAGAAAAQDDVPDAAEPPAAEEGEADAPAPPAEIPPPIYEDKLLRLAEILGSLSFLRELCGEKDGEAWRDEMTSLLEAEQPVETRLTRLIARFNHGFETYNAVYRTCTPSARLAIAHYLTEGQTLASDVRSRYSQ
jgi:uncharacterized protein (TIGR02301 family)